MNKTLEITKMLIKVEMRRFLSSNKSKFVKIILVLMPLIFLPYLIGLVDALFTPMVALNQAWFVFALMYAMVSVYNMLGTVASTVSIFSRTKAMEVLMCMPIRNHQIVTASVIMQYISGLFLSLYIMMITLIYYIVQYGAVFGYGTILPTILVTLLIPVLPVAVGVLIVAPLSRLIGNPKVRNGVVGTVSVLSSAIMIMIMLAISKNQDISMNLTEMLQSSLKFYPPALFAGKFIEFGFTGKGLLNFFYILGINVGAVVITKLLIMNISRHVFDLSDSGVGHSQVKAKHSKGSSGNAGTQASPLFVPSKRSKEALLFKRQFKILTGNSSFLAMYLYGVFMPIILTAIYLFAGIIPQNFLDVLAKVPFIPVVVAGVFWAPAFFSTHLSINLSREGKTFWENKVWPVSAKENVLNRFKFNVWTVLPFQLLLTLGFMIYTKIGMVDGLIGILGGIGFTVFSVSIEMLMELKHPYLDWEYEKQITKSNPKIMATTFIKMGMILVAVLLIVFISKSHVVTLKTFSYLFALLGLILGLISFRILITKGVCRFENIEI